MLALVGGGGRGGYLPATSTRSSIPPVDFTTEGLMEAWRKPSLLKRRGNSALCNLALVPVNLCIRTAGSESLVLIFPKLSLTQFTVSVICPQTPVQSLKLLHQLLLLPSLTSEPSTRSPDAQS